MWPTPEFEMWLVSNFIHIVTHCQNDVYTQKNVFGVYWLKNFLYLELKIYIYDSVTVLCISRTMLKIRALNRTSSSDEDGPTIKREAQVKENIYLCGIF